MFLLFLTVFCLVEARSLADYNYLDPTQDDWYTVQAWELEICQEWGGTQEAASGSSIPGYGSSANATGTASGQIYLSQKTLTLQGRKQTYNVDNFTQILYEVSWYLGLTDGTLEYTVELVNGVTYNISSGTATTSSAGAGHYANYLNESYSKVKMTYGSETLEVPIVDIS